MIGSMDIVLVWVLFNISTPTGVDSRRIYLLDPRRRIRYSWKAFQIEIVVFVTHIGEGNREEPSNIGSGSFEVFDNLIMCMTLNHDGWSGGDIRHCKCAGF